MASLQIDIMKGFLLGCYEIIIGIFITYNNFLQGNIIKFVKVAFSPLCPHPGRTWIKSGVFDESTTLN
jgi:hypothetical protein